MSFDSFSPRARVLIASAVGLVLVVGGLIFLRWRATADLDPEIGTDEAVPLVVENQGAEQATSTDQGREDVPLAMTGPVDRDGDGLGDDEERALGTDPLLRDTDGDGMTDQAEVEQGTDPLVFLKPEPVAQPLPVPTPAPQPQAPQAPLDQDEDGLSDEAERDFGTSPQMSDTDGDGFGDAQEIKNGYNPLGSGLCVRPDCRI